MTSIELRFPIERTMFFLAAIWGLLLAPILFQRMGPGTDLADREPAPANWLPGSRITGRASFPAMISCRCVAITRLNFRSIDLHDTG
ncbi:MAG: hypothetical protein EA415_00280 [Sphaerobacteraceae bacterium]|nr:MAG: hypothetical protein EA415_00280 [Sphaerobacteraceae bacterium]